MNPTRSCGVAWHAAAFALALAMMPLAANANAAEAAQVRFGNSCSPGVQAEFSQAITLLHSFEYAETKRLFGEIIERDPDCAMARWGVAMSAWHPLWAPPSQAELEAGARILADAAARKMTPREAAYVAALQAFYASADPATQVDRVRAYEAKMSEVYANHLDDPEAAVFYALALLASADPRDKSYAHQYKAAALLNWVRASQPRHPGVLHYLIHSYDYPGLAHLALDAALVYADAAPDSAHAQHMPSHIFTRLGLWDRSLASNHDSMRSADEYTHRAHLPGEYDEGLHSLDYLMYALLQTARDAAAAQLLDELHRIDKTDTDNFKVAYTYAAAPARFALERRQWNEAARLELLRPDFPWTEFDWAQSIHHFARGLGAARSGDPGGAERELAVIETLQKGLPPTTAPYWQAQSQVQVDALGAWIAFDEGDTVAAFGHAAAAADREDSVDKHPVTPGEVLPARELYADMLLAAERYADALTQYRTVLLHSPNRLNALLGAAEAAANAGDPGLAESYHAIASRQTREGNRR